jgi:hypothetical protein
LLPVPHGVCSRKDVNPRWRRPDDRSCFPQPWDFEMIARAAPRSAREIAHVGIPHVSANVDGKFSEKTSPTGRKPRHETGSGLSLESCSPLLFARL